MMRKPQAFHLNESLSIPIQYVKGIGPKLSKLFERKGIQTVEDALYFLPRCYEDRREIKKISQLQPGRRETGYGEIMTSGMTVYPFSRKRIFEVVVGDESGRITLKWFHGHERYLRDRFRKGRRLIFSGEVRWFNHRREIHHPDVEIVEGDEERDSLHFKRIVPIYSETEGLPQRTLRRLMKRIVDEYAGDLSSPVPEDICQRQQLIGIQEAFRLVHFPPDDENVETLNLQQSSGHRRIIFDEFFFLQLGLATRKKGASFETGISFRPRGLLAERLLEHLPFQLTQAQRRVLMEIRRDMARPHPMNRLLQGDVGSGKTLVAFLACLDAVECGYQAAFMVPTEVLAEQHYMTWKPWIERAGKEMALLTSGVKGAEREGLYRRIQEGTIPLVVGTHAIIQEGVEFQKLGLAIIDEQHKFGVIQRGLLKKKGVSPDLLVMTATPIPRTLAMTLYGDLDISILDEMPPGRMPVETRVVRECDRPRVYRMMEEEIHQGRQCFIVYPLIEESEKIDLKTATQMADHLQREIFPRFRVGLLHGRMKSEEKESILTDFKNGQIHILVATTVIEVGIDIPNASVMVVEHAERFGLSQLHQLRGRIGRGKYPSKCILMAPDRLSEEAKIRLRAMAKANDGFKIAEEDLKLRGPGEFFGVRQSGFPDFRVAHLVRDAPILAEARREAFRLVEEDPDLREPHHRDLREELRRRWSHRLELATIS